MSRASHSPDDGEMGLTVGNVGENFYRHQGSNVVHVKNNFSAPSCKYREVPDKLITHPRFEAAPRAGEEAVESNGTCRTLADSGEGDGTDRCTAADQEDAPPEFEPWHGADDPGGISPADIALHLAEASLRYRKRWRPGFIWRLSFWVTSTLGILLFLRPGRVNWKFRLPRIRDKVQPDTVSQLGNRPEQNLAATFLETFLCEYSPWLVPLVFEDVLAARRERMRLVRKQKAFEEWERKEALREQDERVTREWRWEGDEGRKQEVGPGLGLGLGLGLGQRHRQKKPPLRLLDDRQSEALLTGNVEENGAGPAHETFENGDQSSSFKCLENESQLDESNVGVEESNDVWLALAQSGVAAYSTISFISDV